LLNCNRYIILFHNKA